MTPPPSYDIESLIEEGLARHRAGDLSAAEERYRSVLAARPDHAEALHLLGLARHQAGHHGEAAALLGRALGQLPGSADVAANLALVLAAAGDAAAAAEAFERALALRPGDAGLLSGLGAQLRKAGRPAEAEARLRAATEADPGGFAPWYNLGNLLLETGDPAAARDAYARALEIDPGNPDAAVNMAAAETALGEAGPAEARLRALLADRPDHAGALNNLGNLLRERGRPEAALECLERATAAAPRSAEALYNLGQALGDVNRLADARAAFGRARAARPDYLQALWADRLSLPAIYRSDDEIAAERARWRRGLSDVIGAVRLDTPAGVAAGLRTISELTDFALPYQGLDDLDLQTAYGGLVARIAGAAFPDHAAETTPDPPPRQSKRLVFVSAHLRQHTVFRLFGGWMTGLRGDRFEVHALSTSPARDAATAGLEAAGVTVHGDCPTTRRQVDRLAELAPDAVVFTDVGMDPLTQVLAGLRLAPLQCAAWGHPTTTGLPTVDAFLSCDRMEPADGAARYSERLVRLPGLSVDYARPAAARTTKPDPARPVFLCSQSLFKIPPAQDGALAGLLKEVPGATLRLIAHDTDAVTRAFLDRLGAALAGHGLDPETRLDVRPRTDRAGFLALHADACAVLDSFRWSGGNTNLEALALGLPVVTLPGRLMRGRHALAMLEILDLPDLIAADEDDWIAVAARLATDADWRGDVEAAVAERSGRLYGDTAWREPLIEALDR